MSSIFDEQFEKVCSNDGFIAALDHSGENSPQALKAYGVSDDTYVKGEKSMFDAIHEMRTRILTSRAFQGDRILGAILFNDTVNRTIKDKPTVKYLWEEKKIMTFLKVDDTGLEEEENGVQLLKAMPELDEILKRAKDNGVFGTKMRSIIHLANQNGINALVDQQFDFGKQICSFGLIPIIEPEVSIKSPQKKEAETMLRDRIVENLNKLAPGETILLKLTLPTVANLYRECIDHPNVLRVVAMSGGYNQEESNKFLAKNHGMVACFSRALCEGLTHDMTAEEFDDTLDASIKSILHASMM